MTLPTRRHVTFVSGATECAAWHYPGTNGACLLMAAGIGVTKEPGTDAFAARFHAAGYSVLAFDYRGFGGSGGRPRQVPRIREQLRDWTAAIAYAARLPEVDPRRLAIWGSSVSGGHVVAVAARHPELAAAVAQTPALDGPALARNAARYQTPAAMARTTALAVADAVGGLLRLPPRLVPLSGPKGSVALLTTPDGQDGGRALDPDGRHAGWQQAAAARAVLALSAYRPGRHASDVRCPLLIVACEDDRSVLTAPAVAAARSAPRAELVRLPGGHYGPYLEGHEQAVSAELGFLDRHLLHDGASPRPAGTASG